MNAPDKLIKIPMAPGVYLLRAATLLLSAMRREKHPRTGKTGRAPISRSYARRTMRAEPIRVPQLPGIRFAPCRATLAGENDC